MPEPVVIAVDVGTTHLKAGLLALDGTIIAQQALPTPLRRASEGYDYFDHELIWSAAAEMIGRLCQHPLAAQVAGIGIAGMAETGLLVKLRSGDVRSRMIPWRDMSAAGQAEQIGRSGVAEERFYASGIRPSFKCSLVKILWLKERFGLDVDGCTWLCAPDFLTYRLTGCAATDYSLASRTYAFRIYEKEWDESWLRQFDLSADTWPQALAWGTAVGKTLADVSGIPRGIPVFIAGHDHVCASLILPQDQPGIVMDSIGTAESLLGVFPRKQLGRAEYESGLAFGCRGTADQFYCLGGLSSAGGAVEWVKNLCGAEISYDQLAEMTDALQNDPGNILFFPYLSGSGSPHSEPGVRASFIGLNNTHRLPDLLKAVLEGTAFEIEFMRRQIEGLGRVPISHIIATGGGTLLQRWMQIRADITACRYDVAQTSEAVLLGAAIIAGVGAGVFNDLPQAQNAMLKPASKTYLPEPDRQARYADIYEKFFIPLQEPLRRVFREGF